MTIKIDKNVPIWEERRHRISPDYPFSQMSVGDSFYYGKSSALITASKRYEKQNPGVRFESREERAGRRIWRVE